MGFFDRLNALADRFHIGSDSGYEQDQPGYSGQDGAYEPYGYDGYGYDGQAQPDVYAQPDEGQYEYEPNRGGAGSPYVTGVKPRSAGRSGQARQKGFFGNLVDRIRGNESAPQYDPQYDAPYHQQQQQQAAPRRDNVIPMSDYEPAYDGQRRAQQQRAPRQGNEYSQQQRYEEPRAQQQPRQQAYTAAARQGKTMIYLVRRLEESEEIIEHMMSGGHVIVNMEEIDEALKRRVLDFISGAAFALECTVKRISYRNYFIAPSGEEVVTNVTATREQPIEEPGYRPRERRYEW